MALQRVITEVTVRETGAKIIYAAIVDINEKGIEALECYRPRHFDGKYALRSANRSITNHINSLQQVEQLALV